MFPLHMLLVAFLMLVVAVSGRQIDNVYMLATFQTKNQGKSNEETWLNIYSSKDGIHFDEYAMDAYRPPKPWLIRDPSIIQYLGTYYVVFTTGWSGSELGIISSKDLKTWQPHATINLDLPGLTIGAAWAPVRVIYASTL
jgi:predicted GH43/DUF377 family glycosyl hydrolase